MVPINARVCRTHEGPVNKYDLMRWDILVTIQNQGGNLNLDIEEAPIDVYVDFDPNSPYGYDGTTGEPRKLGDYPELLRDRPEQQYMSVPRAGLFGGAVFTIWYSDEGSGSPYRRIPTRFVIILDQYRGGAPGLIAESNEGNNGVTVEIDRYDERNSSTGKYLIGCWYN